MPEEFPIGLRAKALNLGCIGFHSDGLSRVVIGSFAKQVLEELANCSLQNHHDIKPCPGQDSVFYHVNGTPILGVVYNQAHRCPCCISLGDEHYCKNPAVIEEYLQAHPDILLRLQHKSL